MKTSISIKLYLFCFIQIFSFVILSLLRIQYDSENFSKSKQISDYVNLIQSVSILIQDIQKERLISISFLSKNAKDPELMEQQQKVDQSFELFKTKVETMESNDDALKSLTENILNLFSFRNSILKRETQKIEVLKRYHETIYHFLDVYKKYSLDIKAFDIHLSIEHVFFVDKFKENFDEIQLEFIESISTDKVINDDIFNRIVILNNKINTDLNSSYLGFSEELKTQIEKLMKSESWILFHETIEKFIKNKNDVSLNQDIKEITDSIAEIAHQNELIINQEISNLVKKSENINQNAKKNLFLFSLILFFVFVTLMSILLLSNKTIFMPIKDSIKNVSDVSLEVTRASDEISQVSKDLSSSSQEQASSLKETSASLEEINKTVSNNISSAESSNKQSIEVFHLIQETAKRIEDLKQAMFQILESNERIADIVKIIEQIGKKTEVIDNIVFKTQLLSFNASLEAERAGDQGRGFSVVAREVGNLAKISGVAAKEISTIVKQSIKDAEDVSQENKSKVHSGEEIVLDLSKKMMIVIDNMQTILDSSQNILSASKEQNTNVEKITQIVSSMNMSIQMSAITAQECSGSGIHTSEQANRLKALVDKMNLIVNGK